MTEITMTYRFETRAQYVAALDKVLPSEYIQVRDIPGYGAHPYIPTPIQEAMADDLFMAWHVVDEKYTMLLNELICTVKLNYTPSFPGADIETCTGSAAQAVQMDSGSKVSDWPANKKLSALEYNLPALRSKAIGNALETLGNIFGRNFGRKLNKNTPLSPEFKIRVHTAEYK